MMLSKTKVRKILGNHKLTEGELEVLRNEMYTLAELFLTGDPSSSGSKKHSWVIDSKNKNNEH